MSKTKEPENFEYEGVDLEAMMLADNYYSWIASTIEPYVGKKVVEVGAGVGSFSKFTDSLKPEAMLLVEPSKNTFRILKENTKSFDTPTKTVNGYLTTHADEVKKFQPDTFIYINVMEHVKDDNAEIKTAANLLENKGHIIIFVPALMALYSNFDKSIDHYRRYTKKSLRKLCEEQGLEVVKLNYMDMPGILPWWFSFVVMKRTKLVPALVKMYDGFCVPIIRFFEGFMPAPVGKNVLIIARKKR